MDRAISGFDWDAGNLAKCQSHGVSIAEVESLFLPDALQALLPRGMRRRRAKGDRSVRGICTRRRLTTMKKKLPRFKSDKAAERFVEKADLSEYDLSQGKPMHFEFEKKGAQLNMRIPQPLLDAVKKRARTRGIPYTRFIREVIEN